MPSFLDDLAFVNTAARDAGNLKSILQNGLSNPIGTLDQFQGLANKYFGTGGNSAVGGGQSRMDRLLARRDPLTSLDWIGLVLDPNNPAASARDPFYIDSIQTPTISLETRSVFRAGKLQHYAGDFAVSNISLKMYTDVEGRAMKFASSWINSVYDSKTGNYRLPKDYKKTIIVYVIDVTQKEVCQFKFYGCWPTNWSSYNFGGGAAEMLSTDLEITVDSFSIGTDAAQVQSSLNLLANNARSVGSAFSSVSNVLGQAKAVQNLFGL